MEEDHRVDEQGQEEVHEHATDHNQQSLPGGLRTELPRLLRLFHLFGVETLVDHTSYLTIAAQWQPTHAVLCVATLGFPFEQAAVPFPDAGVEEQVELVDAHPEEFGEEEVAALMEQHQQAYGQHELK